MTRRKEAIEQSLQKWERIVSGQGVDGGAADCGLCQYAEREWSLTETEKEFSDPCTFCPYGQHHGRSCSEHAEPYQNWITHQRVDHSRKYEFDDIRIEPGCEKCLELATTMYEALKEIPL
jgi:hypothetical protein